MIQRMPLVSVTYKQYYLYSFCFCLFSYFCFCFIRINEVGSAGVEGSKGNCKKGTVSGYDRILIYIIIKLSKNKFKTPNILKSILG